jgi:hypothetical protein
MNRALFTRLACITLCLIATLQLAVAATPPTGVAPVAPPAGGFGIDGDLIANTPFANVGDWIANTNAAPGTGQGVLLPNGTPIDSTRTFHIVDPYNDSSNDRIFSGGAKWMDNPNTWTWTYGKPSAKDDINNALVHIATDTNGHIWVILAADRLSNSGDSYIDFEFLQNLLTRNANGTFTSAGPNGGRTTNDVLLNLDITGGGKVAEFYAWTWTTNGTGGYTYSDITSNLPAGRVFVAVNTNTVSVPFGAFGSTNYAPSLFAEAAIDLTAFLGNFDQCESFGFKTIMIKTKSSASSSSGVDDFVEPIQYNLRIGPSAVAGPDQVRCTGGLETLFPLSGSASSGVFPVVSNQWTVVGGDATIDDPSSLTTTAHVRSATATLRLTVFQANGCAKSDDIVLTVQQPPACTITGLATLCLRKTNSFSGPAGMGAYSWSISGNGSISGPANSQTVTAVAGTNCGQTFTLTLSVQSNVCSAATSSDVLVTDTNGPVLTVPPDRVLDCQASTAPSATGMATATDTCSRVTVTYSDAVTNGCGGSRTITRTWLATDECGNATTGIQTIQARDVTPPVLVCPTNKTVECTADTSPASTGMATATDTCSSAHVSYTDTVTPGCGGSKVIARLWTAVDDCGNATNATQTITVRDTVPPVLTLPPGVTLEAPGDTSTNNTGVATATDACSSVTITYSDTVTNGCGSAKTIARHWTATDACGNASTATQIIIVRDTTAPVISAPPSVTLEYPAVTTTNATGVATATDAGSTPVITYIDSVTNGCGPSKTITRVWTATDACGNASSATQIINVRDTTPPAITLPPSLTLECSQPTATNFTGVATATDAGSKPVIAYSDTVSNSCGATMTIWRLWTATDACGNASSGTQVITVRDTTPPQIFCPPNMTFEAPAVTTTNVTGVATATDQCSTPTVTYSDSVLTNCGSARVISRIWRATDPCGNTSTATQTITVTDTKPPILTCPTNVTVECGSSTAPSATGTATATDAASTPVVTYTDTFTPLCGGTRIITRTWTATDPCGNSTNAPQLITVRDTTPPTLVVPPNVVQQSPGDTRTNVTGVANAQDACGSVALSYSDVVSNSCGQTRTVWRQWTATDQCGNSSTGVQTITVIDTQPPTVTSPTLSFQCPGDVPPPYTNLTAFLAAGGQATDNSTNTLSFALVSDSGLVGRCPGTVTRVYRVTDACGNYTDTTQRITVDDTIPPVITVPTNVTLGCGDSFDPSSLGWAKATDNCSTNVTITYSDVPLTNSTYSLNWYAADPLPNSGPYAPTYLALSPASLPAPTGGRAADPLRNAVAFGPTSNQLDAVTSLSGPAFCLGQVVPFEVVIDVGGAPGPEHGTIDFSASWSTYTTANDHFGFDTNYMVYAAFVDTADAGTFDPNYNAKVESFSSTVINAGTISEQILGNFRVTGLDPGDRIVVEIWVVLMPTQPSHAGGSIAANLVSASKALIPAQSFLGGVKTISINANKMNPLPPPTTQPPLPPQPPQPPVLPPVITSVFNRTWTATDDCGNQSTAVQQITVVDSKPPNLVVPADVTLEYPAATGTNLTGVAVVLNPCGSSVITYSDTVSNTCGGTFVLSRLWSATDDWGNSTNVVQTISVVDTTPPAFSALTNKTIELGQPLVFDTPIATDADGPCTVTLVGTVTNNVVTNAFCSVTRTWTAADVCGNQSVATQQITVVDTTAPSMVVPADVVLEYPANTGPQVTGFAVAQDLSGPPMVTYSDSVSNLCGNANVIFRLWTATDGSGNSTNAIQTIFVLDTTPPVMSGLTNKTIEAGSPVMFDTPVATDAGGPCTVAVLSTVTNTALTNAVCTITRTWTATDPCGNRSTASQQIAEVDTTAPSMVVPTNVVLEFPTDTGTNVTGVAVAQDISGQPAITYSDTVSNSCGSTKVISRLWKATDNWGNSTNAVQTIAVVDTTPPVLSGPTNKNITVGQPLVFDTPTATDADGPCTVTVVSTVTNTMPTGGAYTVTRTWSAADPCGNTASTNQTITVSPAVAPAPNRLMISGSPTGLVLSWPTNAGDYRLESAATQNAKSWNPVQVTPTNLNAVFSVSVPFSGQSQFFRLSDAPPMLNASASSGKLRLIWPTAPSGFQLESCDPMQPGTWTAVTTAPVSSNAMNHVDVPLQPNTRGQVFRLKK